MRDLLRSGLGQALRACEPLDRLAAAWPVAAGGALSSHGTLTAIDDGVLTITVADPAWFAHMISLRGELAQELARTSGVPVREIHFSDPARGRGRRLAAPATPPRTPQRLSTATVHSRPGGRR